MFCTNQALIRTSSHADIFDACNSVHLLTGHLNSWKMQTYMRKCPPTREKQGQQAATEWTPDCLQK